MEKWITFICTVVFIVYLVLKGKSVDKKKLLFYKNIKIKEVLIGSDGGVKRLVFSPTASVFLFEFPPGKVDFFSKKEGGVVQPNEWVKFYPKFKISFKKVISLSGDEVYNFTKDRFGKGYLWKRKE